MDDKPSTQTTLTRDAWIGLLQLYLEERIADAPDDTCRALAHNFWDQTAEIEDD